MANQYQVIDETNWKRAVHCMVFRNSTEPAFCVTFELDITGFLKNQRSEIILYPGYGLCGLQLCKYN